MRLAAFAIFSYAHSGLGELAKEDGTPLSSKEYLVQWRGILAVIKETR